MGKLVKIDKDMDFDVIKFANNKYALDDGTILRISCIVGKVLKHSGKDEFGNPNYLVNTRNFVVAIIKPEFRGAPSSEGYDPIKDTFEHVDFMTINEPWNEYKLVDGRMLKVKLVLAQVVRYEKRNNMGEPVYRIKSQVNVSAGY